MKVSSIFKKAKTCPIKEIENECICVLQDAKGNKKGVVHFKEFVNGDTINTRVTVHIEGLTPGLHGFHIHRSGNLLGGCDTLCEHYNPKRFHDVHGGRKSAHRHMGDLGNVKADRKGVVKTTFVDHFVRVTGNYSIIGRSVIVHADPDDLGKGGNAESLKTGNSGKRVLCGVIGRM